MSSSPGWLLPVLYQVGLVYEQLRQPEKAIEAYDRILASQKDLSKEASSASLMEVINMAKWRKTHLTWRANVETADRDLILDPSVSKATATP